MGFDLKAFQQKRIAAQQTKELWRCEASDVITAYGMGERFFGFANLNNQSFCGAKLPYIDFTCANLVGSDFRNADLTGAGFNNAFLGNVTFSNANLTDASFDSAFLTNTNLSNANLAGADLISARLCGTIGVQFVLSVSSDGHPIIAYLHDGQTMFNIRGSTKSEAVWRERINADYAAMPDELAAFVAAFDYLAHWAEQERRKQTR